MDGWHGMAGSERYKHKQTTRMKEMIMMIQLNVLDVWMQ